MHGNSIQTVVYRQLYPNPRPTDPPCFSAHLKTNLVAEIRAETNAFYGNFDSLEAKYPGLDYTHAPHRMRLTRFTYHRRLFRAFDELNLTTHEILGLCRWEGTRWAREQYERQEGIRIRDTTGQEIMPWDPLRSRRHVAVRRGVLGVMTGTAVARRRTAGAGAGAGATLAAVGGESSLGQVDEEMELVVDEADEGEDEEEDEEVEEIEEEEEEEEEEGEEEVLEEGEDAMEDEVEGEEEDSEGELESVGIELNQRLSAGQVDEAWAEWFKEATETGILPEPASILMRAGHSVPPMISMMHRAGLVRAAAAPSSSTISPPAPTPTHL
ncbi:MAG: hypothetical protein M1816_006674 [Peltula sp. TS41687]|nr:MAG: hypothetical protein M1816_006674 [Peltula sp. TS41687]